MDQLIASLPEKTVVTDKDLLDNQSRDRTDIIPPGRPVAAVLARTTEDVVTAVKWANEHNVPVVPRGAGTGISGGATATDGCLVISVARMQQILDIDPVNFTARVEAGVINHDLNIAAAKQGLMYAPDPSSHEICSIGGNLATNAGGLRCVKYGVTRAHVRTVKVVLPDGRVMETGHTTNKGVAGLDLAGLFVGAEGTLGIITEATVALLPLPSSESVTLMGGFGSVEAAMNAVTEAMRRGADPELMEFMDNATLKAIDEWKGTDFGDYAGLVLAQVRGSGAAERGETIANAFEEFGAQDVIVADSEAEADQLIEIRRMAYPAIERMGHALTEDMCVPRSRLADMMRVVDEVAAEYDLKIYTCAHIGDGNVHPVFVWTEGTSHDMPPVVWEACHKLFEAAWSFGGTITGEHGVGTLKQQFLAEELGEVSVDIHRRIKDALDPKGLFNPGKALA